MIREEMTVNNRSIGLYHARLLNFSVGGTPLSHSQSPDGSLLRLPSVYHTVLSPRPLTITLTFFPKATANTNINRSIHERMSRSTDNIVRFESDVSNRIIEIGLPDGYIYKAFLTSCGTPSFDATGEQDVEYSFLAIRTKAPVTQRIVSGQIIYCESNTDTPFRLSFKVAINTTCVRICGIPIKAINANTEIVVDSELGIVTANGENKFRDTELIDFPRLVPGNNTIECSIPDTEITIVYTPIYA